MTDEIRDAIVDAVRGLNPGATDVSVPDDLSPISRSAPAPISLTWKADDQLHLGNFVAWTRREHERREIEFLEAMSYTDIPVPRVVSTGTAGSTTVVLANLLDGEQMSRELAGASMRWEISAAAFTYARMLARIHTLDWTKVVPWLGDPEAVPEDIIDDQVEDEFQRRSQRMDQVPREWRPFIQKTIDWLELRRPVEVSLCICHGRFHPDNIYAVGEDITAIVNWQHACITDASFDLAMLPVWLNDVGLSPEEAELFAQAAHGAYLQSSPRGLANMPYYSVSLPLDQLIDRLTRAEDPVSSDTLESIKGTIERAIALAGRVPWKSR